jgi:hypothetical protein
MQNRVLVSVVVVFLLVACSQEMPSIFQDISEIEAVSTKKGFLSFKMYFPKDKNPYVQYVNKDGSLNPEIKVAYSRRENDKADNSVIYFFTDEWDGEYQIRVRYNNIVRMRFVNKKLGRNVPYQVKWCEKCQPDVLIKLYKEGQKTSIVQQEKELVRLYKEEKYEEFNDRFINLILSNDTTIDYPFKRLVDCEAVNIVTSNDCKLRFYNLMNSYGYHKQAIGKLFQIRKKGYKSWYVHPQVIIDNGFVGEDEFGWYYTGHYDTIFTIHGSQQTYYLLQYNPSCYDCDVPTIIKSYTLLDNGLSSIALFEQNNSKEPSSEIHIYYSEEKISFDNKKNILYVPIYDGKNNFELFRFKENQFKHIGFKKEISQD